MQRIYGWSPKGEKCIMEPKDKKPRKRFSLELAISASKIVAWELVEGAFNKERFINYINQKLLPHCKRKIHKPVLLMDNVRFHHSKDVKQLLSDHCITPLYNPPYHPDSNPIEMLFAFIKALIRKDPPESIEDLKYKLKTILEHKIDSGMLNRMFRHSELC